MMKERPMKKLSSIFVVTILLSLAAISYVRPSSAEEAAKPGLEVLELVIARDIVNREPIDIGESFPSDVQKLYCYSKIKVDIDATKIYHSWYYNDQKVTQVELNVKRAPGYRTFSNKTIMPGQKGKWEVEVQDSEGNVLSSITFTVN